MIFSYLTYFLKLGHLIDRVYDEAYQNDDNEWMIDKKYTIIIEQIIQTGVMYTCTRIYPVEVPLYSSTINYRVRFAYMCNLCLWLYKHPHTYSQETV